MTTVPVGQTIVGSSRTITDAEVAILPALMGAINPLFHDEETARQSKMGRRILYGPALLGIAVACTEYVLRDIVIGLAGITDVRFRLPVGVGDTITAKLTVLDRMARPERESDVLNVHDVVINQHGDTVLEFHRRIVVRNEGASPPR